MKSGNPQSPEVVTSVYNADERRLVAIFANRFMAGQFVFGRYKKTRSIGALTQGYVNNKIRACPKSTQHSFRIAIRNASKEQIDKLGGLDYLLLDESLSDFIGSISAGFDSVLNKK